MGANGYGVKMLQNQSTLNKEIIFQGIGVHSGLAVNVVLKPAVADSGIIFFNPKFPGETFKIGSVVPEVAMQATVLKQKTWMLSTVEHLLAAIISVGLDNVFVEIDGFEVPILDGSALPFAQAILDTGLQEQSSQKRYITPKEVIRFDDPKTGRFIEIIPATRQSNGSFDYKLKIDYIADFTHKLIGAANFSCEVNRDFFVREIAPARTFGFLEQLPQIRKYGLAKGTSLGNTLVLSNEGFLNEPRFDDECVRHKVLDLIGDLGLLGLQIVGHVKACKSGHNFNREVAASLISNPEKWMII